MEELQLVHDRGRAHALELADLHPTRNLLGDDALDAVGRQPPATLGLCQRGQHEDERERRHQPQRDQATDDALGSRH